MEGPAKDSPAEPMGAQQASPDVKPDDAENAASLSEQPDAGIEAAGSEAAPADSDAEPRDGAQQKGSVGIKREDSAKDAATGEHNEASTGSPASNSVAGSATSPYSRAGEVETKSEVGAKPTTKQGEPEIERLKKKPASELTQLERAKLAAHKAKISTLPELDPLEAPPRGSGLPKHQHRYALSAIRAIKRLKDAAPFVAPVDPIKQGVPQYFDYIKHPMDLGTMEKKLVEQSYDTIKEFIDDFNLIVSNCITFNGEEALISQMALAISQSFKKQLSNMPTYDATRKGAQALAAATSGEAHPAVNGDGHGGKASVGASSAAAAAVGSHSNSAIDDSHHEEVIPKRQSITTTIVGPNGMPTLRRKSTIDGRPKREIRPPRQPGAYFGSGSGQGRPRNKKYASELRFAGQVLREMQSRKLESVSWPFLQPVDPVEQGVPTYFEVIKEPMDLSTIQRKLMEGIYYTGEEFESDVRLMFRNCYTFNPDGTPVNVLGHKLEEYFDSRWVDKPIPGAHNPEDSDMSDVDEEYAESGVVSPAIDVLEEQRRMINKQLKRLKKEALAEHYKRGSKGRSSAPKRRRSSNAATNGGHGGHSSHGGSGNAPGSSAASSRPLPTEMTYEMKRQIHDQMENLSQQQIATVIAIIQESMPEMRGQDEIELEVDALDTQTQLRIYNYAVLNRADKPLTGSTRSGSNDDDNDTYTRKKKSKALSEEEHELKVAEINRKIKEIKEAQGGSTPGSMSGLGEAMLSATPSAASPSEAAAGSAGIVAGESDSSDEEMDSDSSSEEE